MNPEPDSQLKKIFPGNSELARRMRDLDWSKSGLGLPELWQQSLRTAIRICLASASPAAIWWGPNLIHLYNDAFIPFLGDENHPHCLGKPASDCWRHIWKKVEPLCKEIQQTGIGNHSEDLLFTSTLISWEELFAVFGFTPILHEDGSTVEGLFVTCTKTTGRLLENMTDGLTILDGEFRFTYVNKEAERLIERPRAEMLGKVVWEIFPYIKDSLIEDHLRQAVHQQSGVEFEGYNPIAKKWYHNKAYPLPNGSISIYFSDITERKLDHERLTESERRFSTAFNASPFIVSISSINTGKLIEVNETFVQVSGYSREEAIGHSTVELGIWVNPELRAKEMAKLKTTGQIRNLECKFSKRNGEQLIGLLSAERIVIGGEECVLSVVQDITERKKSEEKLEAAQKQLQLVTDTMASAVIRCDRERRYIWVSHAYATLINVPAEEMYGKTIAEVMGEEAYETIRPYIDRVLTGERIEYEAYVNYRGAGPRWVNVRYNPIFDESNRPDGWVAVIDDITKRRELEDALIRADRRKDEFLATLAHELRNPLAPIKNGLEIMRLAKDDLRTIEHSRAIIERQIQQMVRLIDDLLDLSRVSRGKITLRKETIDMSAAIQNAIESSRPLLQQSNHSLIINMPEEKLYVHGDLTRLSQIFANLLNNAAKYTASGGKIEISMSNSGDEAVVSIKDNGSGIAAEMLPHVFEMFAQAARSVKHSHDGLGIGLSIVKRLAEMHNGRVEAKSKGEGKGSEFIVSLPLVKVKAAHEQNSNQKKEFETIPGYKILVVDDNEDSAASMAKMMELMGNMVRIANSGISALQVAEKFRPNFIFLDIGMPEMDGYEVCRRIRKVPWGAGIIIVALTGWGQDEDKRKSYEAGFNQHMVKPIDFNELERLLQNQ